MDEATKIDDRVPTTTPNSIGWAKLATAAPPAMAIGNNASAVVTEVNTVRLKVAVMLSFSTCGQSIPGWARKVSRTRSNTTTLSLTEYPISASNAATAVKLKSRPVSTKKPMVLVTSSSTVKVAASAKCDSKRSHK